MSITNQLAQICSEDRTQMEEDKCRVMTVQNRFRSYLWGSRQLHPTPDLAAGHILSMSPSLANHQGYTLHQHAKQWASNKQMKHIETKQLQNKAHTLFLLKPRNLKILQQEEDLQCTFPTSSELHRHSFVHKLRQIQNCFLSSWLATTTKRIVSACSWKSTTTHLQNRHSWPWTPTSKKRKLREHIHDTKPSSSFSETSWTKKTFKYL